MPVRALRRASRRAGLTFRLRGSGFNGTDRGRMLGLHLRWFNGTEDGRMILRREGGRRVRGYRLTGLVIMPTFSTPPSFSLSHTVAMSWTVTTPSARM